MLPLVIVLRVERPSGGEAESFGGYLRRSDRTSDPRSGIERYQTARSDGISIRASADEFGVSRARIGQFRVNTATRAEPAAEDALLVELGDSFAPRLSELLLERVQRLELEKRHARLVDETARRRVVEAESHLVLREILLEATDQRTMILQSPRRALRRWALLREMLLRKIVGLSVAARRRLGRPRWRGRLCTLAG